MNDFGTLYSERFFEETFKEAIEYSRDSSVFNIVKYYTFPDQSTRVLEYWTVTLIPLRRCPFKSARVELEMARRHLRKLVCIVVAHDDLDLALLLGGESHESWRFAVLYITNNKIVYCRSVFAEDVMSNIAGRLVGIRLVSQPIANPSIESLFEAYYNLLTPLTVAMVPKWPKPVQIGVGGPTWRPELRINGMPFRAACKNNNDYTYWFGPSHEVSGPAPQGVLISSPDGVHDTPHLSLQAKTTDFRFRWPFQFEKLLAMSFVGMYQLPLKDVATIVELAVFHDFYRDRMLPCWVNIVKSVTKIASNKEQVNNKNAKTI